jgi:hypothetical protein
MPAGDFCELSAGVKPPTITAEMKATHTNFLIINSIPLESDLPGANQDAMRPEWCL